MTTVPEGVTVGNMNGGAVGGQVIGFSGVAVYRLDGAFGSNPHFVQIGVTNTLPASPVFVGNRLFSIGGGYPIGPGLPGSYITEVDTITFTEVSREFTGVAYVGPGGMFHTTGLTFRYIDPIYDHLWEYTLGSGNVSIDLGPTVQHDYAGMEKYDGVVYASFALPAAGAQARRFVFGTINPATGQYTQLRDLDEYRDAITGITVAFPQSNQPPVATNDFYVMNQATTLNVPAPGVQANDVDPDEDPLTATLVDGPSHATSFTLHPDGSFTYTPLPYFFGTDTFTYKVNDGTEDSNVATVSITVNQPGAGGFITGGGKFFDDDNKCTFGFVAKVLATGVQGNLEFQDHDSGLNVKSTNLNWVYAPNSVEGYFSGACTVNGQSGYSFFVSVHDRGEPGRDDDFTIWVFDSLGIPHYFAEGQLTASGNIKIHS